MNWLDLQLTAVPLSTLLVILLGAGSWLLWQARARLRAADDRISILEREVAVYAEASTRVATTVESMLLARVKPGEQVHSSRRYVLQQARDRISRGDQVSDTARALGLSFDESRLLERARRHAQLGSMDPDYGQAPVEQAATNGFAPAP